MTWKKEPPNEDGWYWAKHHAYGTVIVHMIFHEGVHYVADNGRHGLNKLYSQYTEWDHNRIKSPDEL